MRRAKASYTLHKNGIWFWNASIPKTIYYSYGKHESAFIIRVRVHRADRRDANLDKEYMGERKE